jgi:hypothetical protein
VIASNEHRTTPHRRNVRGGREPCPHRHRRPHHRLRFAWTLQRFIVNITYVGRRSGTTFTTPVLYFTRGDTIRIHVASPDSKNWWRNFLGDGGPLTLHLPGGDRTGHATATRSDTGRVHVDVAFDRSEPGPAPPT